jgi:hypothetical protein
LLASAGWSAHFITDTGTSALFLSPNPKKNKNKYQGMLVKMLQS